MRVFRNAWLLVTVTLLCVGRASSTAADAPVELPDLSTIPKDLFTPAMGQGKPAPGLRVRVVTTGWTNTSVHHALYLPTNWQSGKLHPVIVEYAGNGNYRNKFGDVSHGTVEGSNMGYGISGGRDFIWICMPYVGGSDNARTNAVTWWGDADETARYCVATVREVCERFGGDTNRVILCGFSRGAIGCNFIGLRNDEIAALWRGFIAHSHYDGVITKWPYAGADRDSALARLKRLNNRPQFISQERSTKATEDYLAATGIKGRFTFEPMPYRNHSDEWTLRDIPQRRRVREWLEEVLKHSN